MAATKKSAGNVKTTHFEFMGPPGAAMMLVMLPITAYGLYCACPSLLGCPELDAAGSHCARCTVLALPELPPFATFFDASVFGVYVLWVLFQALLAVVLPGETVLGLPLRDGTRLPYKMNGLLAFFVTLALFVAGHFLGVFDAAYLYHNYLPLMTASMIFSYALSVYLYVSAKCKDTMLAEGGNSGYAVYDFFIGHELNPRIGNFDLKSFFELRPGLIGWVLLDLGLAAEQYQREGSVSVAMIMICAFQTWYVFDAFKSEPAILSTMDIIQDGFGFMLAFGDLAWVPFTYTLQCRYLVDHPRTMSWAEIAGVLFIQGLGYWIFRSANGLKDAWKRNPDAPELKHIEYIKTERGTRLIASSWWGLARHINYLGDLLMGIAWCLPCGFDSPLPYYYAVYFAILLIHRERRDDHKCAKKYGKDWDKYRAKVPSRIVPYIY